MKYSIALFALAGCAVTGSLQGNTSGDLRGGRVAMETDVTTGVAVGAEFSATSVARSGQADRDLAVGYDFDARVSPIGLLSSVSPLMAKVDRWFDIGAVGALGGLDHGALHLIGRAAVGGYIDAKFAHRADDVLFLRAEVRDEFYTDSYESSPLVFLGIGIRPREGYRFRVPMGS